MRATDAAGGPAFEPVFSRLRTFTERSTAVLVTRRVMRPTGAVIETVAEFSRSARQTSNGSGWDSTFLDGDKWISALPLW